MKTKKVVILSGAIFVSILLGYALMGLSSPATPATPQTISSIAQLPNQAPSAQGSFGQYRDHDDDRAPGHFSEHERYEHDWDD